MWQDTKNIYHLFIAMLANVRYGFLSKHLTVIGVTGTDGKTTTVSLIYHILKSSGKRVSMISTLGAVIDGQNYPLPFHVTTPSSFAVQKFLKKIIKNADYLVLEVTSHALDQYRTWGINFEVGVLTNATHEHLDYHKTYKEYVKTKLRLIKIAKTGVVNMDDDSYNIILNLKSKKIESKIKNQKLITYGIREDANITPEKFTFKTNLLGEFNRYNILAATAACRELGIKDEDIKQVITSFNPPQGRQELVHDGEFQVIIDFAHTPNAFEKILSTIRPETKGNLIHVFGSAGERDVTKRPKMGEISGEYSDIIILTSEDPRSESVSKIINDIMSGIQNSELRTQNETLIGIPNRQDAINKAISMAKKGDVVLITGKAHEKSMNYGHGEEPWDEYEAVEKALALR